MNTITILLLAAAVLGLTWAHKDDNDDGFDLRKCKSDKCKKMPKAIIPDIDTLNQQPPMYFIYALRHDYDCAAVTFSKPTSGNTCYNGKSSISPLNATSLLRFTFARCANEDDRCLTAVDSISNVVRIWYFWAFEFSDECSWMCAYTCNDKDDKFYDFICVASNDNHVHKLKEVVLRAQCVCNGRKIYNCRKGCPDVNECFAK